MISIFSALLLFTSIIAYNVSPKSSKIVSTSYGDNSYFGYTVALLRNRLLVGAPKSISRQSSFLLTSEPGAIFSCDIQSDGSGMHIDTCTELPLPITGDNVPSQNFTPHFETAWLGGALSASEVNTGSYVVCAPRWKNQMREGYLLMNGLCYSSGLRKELIPLVNGDNQGYRVSPSGNTWYWYSYGQAGFSVHLTPEDNLVLGAPGLLMWTGSVVHYNRSGFEPVVVQPIRTPQLELNDYFGYAVSSGRFDRGQRLYVASAPRGAVYTGKVIVYEPPTVEDAPLKIRALLIGSQMGEYFGASVCVSDVNADGLDDLLIGAPLHSKRGVADVGVVYVYHSSDVLGTSRPRLELTGSSSSGGRFGTSIGAIGDIDQDGYPDIAVGAPYEEGGGCVYIYRGSPNGLTQEPSQVLNASQFSAPLPLQGFGISISKGVDVDDDMFPEFAVGAYESGQAVILRSRHPVKLEVRLSRSIARIGYDTHQFNVDICIENTGNHKPPYINLRLDVLADRVHRRAIVLPRGPLNVTLQGPQPFCRKVVVQLLSSPASWHSSVMYSSLPVSASLKLLEDCPTCLIADPTSVLSQFVTIPVLAACNNDVCIPKWGVEATVADTENNTFIVGSKDTITLTASVVNNGDNARLRLLNVSLPRDVQLRASRPFCEKGDAEGNWNCLSGFRIDSRNKVYLNLTLDVRNLNSTLITVNLSTVSYDSAEEVTAKASVYAIKVYKLKVSGRADPPLHVVRDSTPTSVLHSYDISCEGYSPITQALVTFTVPTRVKIDGTWKDMLNVTTKATLRELDLICNKSMSTPPPTRWGSTFGFPGRSQEKKFECHTPDVECSLITCEGGPLNPQQEGISVDIYMDVNGDDLVALLENFHYVNLTTTAEASFPCEPGLPNSAALATEFSGSLPAKENPLFWLFIALAVIVALAVLILVVLLLWKCGFFVRKKPTDEYEPVPVPPTS